MSKKKSEKELRKYSEGLKEKLTEKENARSQLETDIQWLKEEINRVISQIHE